MSGRDAHHVEILSEKVAKFMDSRHSLSVARFQNSHSGPFAIWLLVWRKNWGVRRVSSFTLIPCCCRAFTLCVWHVHWTISCPRQAPQPPPPRSLIPRCICFSSTHSRRRHRWAPAARVPPRVSRVTRIKRIKSASWARPTLVLFVTIRGQPRTRARQTSKDYSSRQLAQCTRFHARSAARWSSLTSSARGTCHCTGPWSPSSIVSVSAKRCAVKCANQTLPKWRPWCVNSAKSDTVINVASCAIRCEDRSPSTTWRSRAEPRRSASPFV